MTEICTFCGTEFKDGESVCSFCGTPRAEVPKPADKENAAAEKARAEAEAAAAERARIGAEAKAKAEAEARIAEARAKAAADAREQAEIAERERSEKERLRREQAERNEREREEKIRRYKEARRKFLEKREAWLSKNSSFDESHKAVKYLKKRDLDCPTIKDAVMAARCADLDALEKIKKNGFSKWSHPDIMLAACHTPFLAVVRFIHRNGGNVNARDEGGRTPLSHCGRNPDIVKYLVDNGADVNAKNKYGVPVLVEAMGGPFETVKYLVDHGADVNARVPQIGWPPC